MPFPNFGSRTSDPAAMRLAGDNFASLALWPGVCLVLGILLWGLRHSGLSADRRTLEDQASTVASSLSKGYAQHLTRTLEQLDQLALQAKHSWEQSRGVLRLEQLKKEGMFSVADYGAVTIFNRDGVPLTSTNGITKKVSVADRDYFLLHKHSDRESAHIGRPVQGRVTGKEIIPISRRIDGADGSFGGVVVVSVEPAYFSLYSDNPFLGDDGLLALTGKDGAVRMTKIGATIGTRNDPILREGTELNTKSQPVLLSGTRWFADGKTRLVASHPLDDYPFFAVVGLSEEELLRPYEQSRQASMRAAIGGTIVLLLFATVSTVLSLRLARRKQWSEAVRDTYRFATEGGNEAYFMGRAIRSGNDTVDFQIVDCNERAAVLVRQRKDKLINAKLSALYRGAPLERVMAFFRRAMELGYYEDEYEVPKESLINAKWVHRRMVRSGQYLAVTIRDISAQKTHESELTHVAAHDRLTGLPNRHWLVSNLPALLQRAAGENRQLAILSLDLDGFKNVNDAAGHSVGDRLLQAVATRLRTLSRPTDGVVRLGGDEFTVVIEPTTSRDEMALAAQRIMEALRVPIEVGERKYAITASIGIAIFPRDGSDAEALLKNADIAMYSAKAECKGRFRFYDEKLYERIRKRIDIERELGRALEEDHFVMHYQPRVSASTGTMVGMEALVRWAHPERGIISPNDFIPLAESTGMIIPLGELIMKKTCNQLAAWIRDGLPVVPVSVNVSARQFNEGKVRDILSACLVADHIPPELLEIELTESAMMGDLDVVMKEVQAINALGVRIHVDDFGTGYSSLALLHKLDMDVLKVDREFTTQLGTGKDGTIFFAAIVSMAKALGMSVVAEGVETTEQLRILQGLDCDEIQGYLVSRPLPAAEVPALILKKVLLS